MALYVKKPVVIEAEWFDRSTFDIVAEFCPTAQGMYFDSGTDQYYIIIPTLEGDHRANEGWNGMYVTHWMEIQTLPEPPKEEA